MITTKQLEKTAPEKTTGLTSLFVGTMEWRFVGICALVMVILTSLPYLFGYFITPSDRVFMGMTTSDIAQYMSWMRGFETSNLIDNHLTAEPSEPIFFNLLWWFLAKIKVIFHLNAIATI